MKNIHRSVLGVTVHPLKMYENEMKRKLLCEKKQTRENL